MLRTRLWMGAVLIALAAGMLRFDQALAPLYPFLLAVCLLVGFLASSELLHLLGPERRPAVWLGRLSVLAVLASNWPARVWPGLELSAWGVVVTTFAATVLAAFIVEMYGYRAPGGAVNRLALAAWMTAYLGLLPSFLVQLRWLAPTAARGGEWRGVAALALAIFVPKACDIGAFFTGKLCGRHRMTPVLSPNKTWEGFAGGLLTAVVVAVGLNRWLPALGHDDVTAVGFGLTVGLAAVLGDLAESLVKRDCRQKDASQIVPGFGGVLDVIDSPVFAAPVAYLWLRG